MKSTLKNRTVFTRDNLGVMRGMADECIDLIYLIVPKSKGGADTDENLQLLCGYRNRVKGDRTQEYLISQVRMTG